MASDSDRTIDSDEFQELISKANKSALDSELRKNKRRTNSDEEVPLKKCKTASQLPVCQYGRNCFRKNPDHIKNFYHGDESANNSPPKEQKSVNMGESCSLTKDRPKCQFGKHCYRKNPQHLSEFDHEEEPQERTNPLQCPNYQFYLTKVSHIPPKYNALSLDIKDLLSFKDGTLIKSAQFNYCFDIDWLMNQYPEKYRQCPLTIVHGEQRESKKALEKYGVKYPNIKFCQAKLDIPFGTHHTKMMLLLYQEGLRIVIHTSNLVESDWFQKTQGMWVSPLLPKGASDGVGPTHFKADLLEYLSSYGGGGLEEWTDILKEHDCSHINVFLIGSVPGRHVGSKKTSFGHLKLRKVLHLHGPSNEIVKSEWPVIGQFSSIGSLGASPDQWLKTEFGVTLSTTQNTSSVSQSSCLKLVFPSVENVRKSLEGYPAGASLPYSHKVAQKQTYLKGFMHQWRSDRLGRSEASPHIKTYLRVSPDHSSLAYFLLTSANLSKAAWGSLEKKGAQFMIRSYELGVLFLPKYFEVELFSTPFGAQQNLSQIFPLPFDVPLTPYTAKDEPWIWDIPHTSGPDRYGNMWCPP